MAEIKTTAEAMNAGLRTSTTRGAQWRVGQYLDFSQDGVRGYWKITGIKKYDFNNPADIAAWESTEGWSFDAIKKQGGRLYEQLIKDNSRTFLLERVDSLPAGVTATPEPMGYKYGPGGKSYDPSFTKFAPSAQSSSLAPDIQKGMAGEDAFYYHYTEAGNGDKIAAGKLVPDADGRIYFFDTLEEANAQIFQEISRMRALGGKSVSEGYDIVAIPRSDLDVYGVKPDPAAPDSSAMYAKINEPIKISSPFVMRDGENQFVAPEVKPTGAPEISQKISETAAPRPATGSNAKVDAWRIPNNIYSDSGRDVPGMPKFERGLRAALTNPTSDIAPYVNQETGRTSAQDAFALKNINRKYPVVLDGRIFPSAEHAFFFYQNELNLADSPKLSAERRQRNFDLSEQLMTRIIAEKLRQNPSLIEGIDKIAAKAGITGQEWIAQQSHYTGGAAKREWSHWTGDGLDSGFLRALSAGYSQAKAQPVSEGARTADPAANIEHEMKVRWAQSDANWNYFPIIDRFGKFRAKQNYFVAGTKEASLEAATRYQTLAAMAETPEAKAGFERMATKALDAAKIDTSIQDAWARMADLAVGSVKNPESRARLMKTIGATSAFGTYYESSVQDKLAQLDPTVKGKTIPNIIADVATAAGVDLTKSGAVSVGIPSSAEQSNLQSKASIESTLRTLIYSMRALTEARTKLDSANVPDGELRKGATLSDDAARKIGLVVMKLSDILHSYADPATLVESQKMVRFGGLDRRGTISPGAELVAQLLRRGEPLTQKQIDNITSFSRPRVEAYARAMGVDLGNISAEQRAFRRPLEGEIDHSLPEQRFVDALMTDNGAEARRLQASVEESYSFRTGKGKTNLPSAKIDKAIANTMKYFPALAERVVPTPSGFTRSARGTFAPIFELTGGYRAGIEQNPDVMAAMERESAATRAFATGESTTSVALVKLGNILKAGVTIPGTNKSAFDELLRVYLTGEFAAERKAAAERARLVGPIASLGETASGKINPLDLAEKYREKPTEKIIRALNSIEIAIDVPTAQRMGVISQNNKSLPNVFARVQEGTISPRTYVSSRVRVLPGGAIIDTDPAYIEAYGFPRVLPYKVEATGELTAEQQRRLGPAAEQAKPGFELVRIEVPERGAESPVRGIVPYKPGGKLDPGVDARRMALLSQARSRSGYKDVAMAEEETQGGLPKGRESTFELDRKAKLSFIVDQLDLLGETKSATQSREIVLSAMNALRENMSELDWKNFTSNPIEAAVDITGTKPGARWNLSATKTKVVLNTEDPIIKGVLRMGSPEERKIAVGTDKYPVIFQGDRSPAIDDMLMSVNEVAKMAYRFAYALGYGSNLAPLGTQEASEADIKSYRAIADAVAKIIDAEYAPFAVAHKAPTAIAGSQFRQEIVPSFRSQAEAQLGVLKILEERAKFKPVVDPETGNIIEEKPVNLPEPLDVKSFTKEQLAQRITQIEQAGGEVKDAAQLTQLKREYERLLQGERVPDYENIIRKASTVNLKPGAAEGVTPKPGMGLQADPVEAIARELAAVMLGEESPDALRGVLSKNKLLDMFNETPAQVAADIIRRAWLMYGDKAMPDLAKNISFNYNGREYFGTMGIDNSTGTPDIAKPVFVVQPARTTETFLPTENPLGAEPSIRQDTEARKQYIAESEANARAGLGTESRDYFRAEDRARTIVINRKQSWNAVRDTVAQLFAQMDVAKLDSTVRVFVEDMLKNYVDANGKPVTYEEVLKNLDYVELSKSGPYSIAQRLFDKGINGNFDDVRAFIRATQDPKESLASVSLGGRYAADLGVDENGKIIVGGQDVPDTEFDYRAPGEVATEQRQLAQDIADPNAKIYETGGFNPEVGSADHNAMMAYEQGKMFAGLGMPWTKALERIGRPLREAPGSMKAFHGTHGFGAGFAADAAYMAWKGYLDPTSLAISAGFNAANFLPMKYAPKVGLIGAAANLGLSAVTGADMGRAAMMTIGGLLGGAVGAFGGGFGAIGGSFAGSEIADYIWSDVFGNKYNQKPQLMPNLDSIAPKTIKITPHITP